MWVVGVIGWGMFPRGAAAVRWGSKQQRFGLSGVCLVREGSGKADGRPFEVRFKSLDPWGAT